MKPSIDNLEVVAIRNQLDVAVWAYIAQGRQDFESHPRIRDLSKRYLELTGEHYVYQDTRGVYTD